MLISASAQFQGVTTVSSAEVQNVVFGGHGQKAAENVDFSAGDVVIAHGAGVGDQVDLVEKRLPPVRVHVNGHDSSR